MTLCVQCDDWPQGMEPEPDSVSVSHHPHCFFAGVGEPSFKGVGKTQIGDWRDDYPFGEFDGTYPVRLNEKGERVAGYKNPPPPGTTKESEGA